MFWTQFLLTLYGSKAVAGETCTAEPFNSEAQELSLSCERNLKAAGKGAGT